MPLSIFRFVRRVQLRVRATVVERDIEQARQILYDAAHRISLGRRELGTIRERLADLDAHRMPARVVRLNR